uniref:Vascular endothelial growth factor receptor 2 n=1 Tax=Cotesia chilonis TaxID=89804 RepID=A0A1J0M5I3_9HYME|nr:vascular endothelial growth factor receptor 2 [Cotesia chilonis]
MGVKFFCFVLLNIYASLAQQSNVEKIFYAETGDDVVFPCLPTSPEQKVKLLMDGAELELDDRLIYDPKVGFTMELVTSADSGRYQCVNKEETEELNFYVDVKENCNVTAMEKPTRIRYSVKHLVEDGELRINCAGLKPSTRELKVLLVFPFTELDRSRATFTTNPKPKITDCLDRSSIEVRYQNFTKQDEGLYRCNIKNTIYSYVRVTMEDAKEKYQKLETVEIPMDAEDP